MGVASLLSRSFNCFRGSFHVSVWFFQCVCDFYGDLDRAFGVDKRGCSITTKYVKFSAKKAAGKDMVYS